MVQSIQNSAPAKITAGDTLIWQISLADYPASAGWVLHYRLINSAGKIDITAAASGDEHLVNVSASTSAAYAAGDYDWQAYVDGVSSQRFTIGTGRMQVLANLAAVSTTYDNRSTAKKALDAVNAWLSGRDLAVAEYEIAGRRMKYISITDLISIRSKLQAEVNREEASARIARGESVQNKLLVRF